MISNSVISQRPFVLKQVLSNSITEKASQNGVDEAINLIESNVRNGMDLRMLIDVSDYSFETLEARRIWSLQFKMNTSIQKKTSFVAIVGSPHEASDTEKMWMGTTSLKFFEMEQEAVRHGAQIN